MKKKIIKQVFIYKKRFIGFEQQSKNLKNVQSINSLRH